MRPPQPNDGQPSVDQPDAGRSRRRRPSRSPSLAAGLLTGAMLAAVVAGGGVLLTHLTGASAETTDLGIVGQTDDPGDGLVDQLPVPGPGSGATAPGAAGGDFQLPDTLIPGGGFALPDTLIPGGGFELPDTLIPSRAPNVPAAPGSPILGTVPNPLPVPALPTGAAPPAPAESLAKQAAPSPAAVAPAPPAAPSVAKPKPCPSATTSVDLTVNRRTVVLVPLLTPLARGTVKAPPSGSGLCAPTAAVTVPLDVLGRAKVALAPGTWTFSAVGHSVFSPIPSTVVAGESGGSRSVDLVVK